MRKTFVGFTTSFYSKSFKRLEFLLQNLEKPWLVDEKLDRMLSKGMAIGNIGSSAIQPTRPTMLGRMRLIMHAILQIAPQPNA